MLTTPPPRPLELLVVGGLTIDRFPDGSIAPGGSVLHAARAMWLDGRRVAVVTVAGDEPEARHGLDELRRLGELHLQPAEATIGFGHGEEGGGRRLRLLATGDRVRLPELDEPPAAVLYAPVVDELDPAALDAVPAAARRGAILQGWLRRVAPGEAVHGRPLRDLPADLLARLGEMDLLVASSEDLAAEAATPAAQLDALRQVVGPRPITALTAGTEGVFLDVPGEPISRVRPSRVIVGVSAVGAGDAFAAAMLAALARGVRPLPAAADAGALVAEHLAERSGRATYVLGDVHGMLEPMRVLLRDAGLTDAQDRWSGGRHELWLTGDLVDRGPAGVEVIAMLMRLQHDAASAGGRVASVAGNHELLLLAAREIPDEVAGGPGGTFLSDWLANGGQHSDLDALTPEHASWLRRLPAVARVGTVLLVHADATLYASLGASVSEVNERWIEWLATADPDRWDELLAGLSARRAFLADPNAADRLLARFGGRQIVHGHTPISHLVRAEARQVSAPHLYADGRVVAVDAGLAAGAAGFLYRLPAATFS
ncbi:MAG TPA: PfkB family carbohydrate kinase [Candidatus Limnocylindria bacterium]|nr:PfkB family carbohydrate kinase [Candidatus Limnocylindria bacterium]